MHAKNFNPCSQTSAMNSQDNENEKNEKNEEITRWIDGCLDPARAAELEADSEGSAHREKMAWQALRPLLQEHLPPPPMESPDFLNARILEAIEADRRKERIGGRRLPNLRRLVFAGLGSLAGAALLSLVLLPQVFRPQSHDAFVSEVISARTFDPRVSVATFSASDNRSVVLWLEGTRFIPPQESVR